MSGETTMVSMVRVPESEYLALRQDNDRLKGEVEKWKLLAVKEGLAADHTKSDLQRHKSLLEKANERIKELGDSTKTT